MTYPHFPLKQAGLLKINHSVWSQRGGVFTFPFIRERRFEKVGVVFHDRTHHR